MASDFNHFGDIAAALPELFSEMVRKAAFDIAAGAARRAPVDTGFLRNSIYVVTSESSSYGTSSESAIGRVAKIYRARMGKNQELNFARSLEASLKTSKERAAAEARLLPEISETPDALTAYVAVGASYGIYVEMGTRHMHSQPYFYPAVERVRGSFETALERITDKLKEVK